jgi:hypothetical protein
MLDFFQNRVNISGSFSSSGERDHAERAHVVATSHDAQKGSMVVLVSPDRHHIRVGFIQAQLHIHLEALFFTELQ